MSELEIEFYNNYRNLIKEIAPKRKRSLRKAETLRLSNNALISLIKVIVKEKGLANIDHADAYNALLIAKLLIKLINSSYLKETSKELEDLKKSIGKLEELGNITKKEIRSR